MSAISNIINQFASANRYRVSFQYGLLKDVKDKIKVFVKSVEIPGVEKKTFDFIWNGIKFPIARENAYKNTTEVTFYFDEDGSEGLHAQLISWLNTYTHGNYQVKKDQGHPVIYNTMIIDHLSNIGNIAESKPFMSYQYNNIFPTEISSVSLSNDNNGILEYTVTFMYSDWEVI